MNKIFKVGKSELWRYFGETTIHGFSYIAGTTYLVVQLFWVAVIIAGFTCTYFICRDVMSDWSSDPFFTTIGSGRVTEIQFPTVTACLEPPTDVDRWALVRKIANEVTFDCRRLQCDTDVQKLARESTATKTILEKVTERVSQMLEEAHENTYQPADFPENYLHLIPRLAVIGANESAVEEAVRRSFAFRSSWEEAANSVDADCGGGGGYFDCYGTCEGGVAWDCYSSENLTLAAKTGVKLVFLTPTQEVTFGRFLEKLAGLVGAVSGFEYIRCDNISPAAAQLNKYFVDLAEAAGFSGGFSLLELPVVFNGDRSGTDMPFAQILCANPEELRFEENRASAWYEYLFYKDKIKEHPCDINNVKACSFWSDLLLADNSLATLTKILKISGHLGHWRNYSIPTEDFPARKDLDEYDQYSNYGNPDGYDPGDVDTTGDSNNDNTRELAPEVESSFVLHEPNEGAMTFQPTVTNNGLCLAANAEPVRKLIKDGHPYAEVFNEAFEDETKSEIKVANNKGTGHMHSLTFHLVNHFSLNTLHDENKAEFSIALNGQKNAFNIRSGQIQIKAGYHTIIRVLAPQLSHIAEDVETMDKESRKCKLASESEGMELFKDYTEAGCRFECTLRHSAQKCRCIPWNYPNPISNITKTCDFYSAHCFELAMAAETEAGCQCADDCHGLRFAFSVQQVPIDSATVCKIPQSPFRRLLKYGNGDGNFPHNFLLDMTSLLHGKSYYDGSFLLDHAKEWEEANFERICWAMFQRAGAEVTVQVDSDVYTKIGKSRKWSLGAVVGTIGGNLGLFTGMSIISLVEIVFWIARAVPKCTRGHGKGKRESASTNT